jgi:hypothetical protein
MKNETIMEKQLSGNYSSSHGRKRLVTITFLLFAGSVASFSMNTRPSKKVTFVAKKPLRQFSTGLKVATEPEMGTESFPKFGKDGLYHITTPEQHK